jgi:HEAT repeat protein
VPPSRQIALPQHQLIQLYGAEKDLALREAMLRAMANGDQRVVPLLIKQLDGPSSRAATVALRKLKPPSAVPALRRALLASKSSNGMRDVTALLGDIGTPEAAAALADNLERLAKIDDRYEDWGNTLWDFGRAIGKRQLRYRGRDIEGLREAALKALADWRASQSR